MNKFIASSLIGYTYGALTPLPANTFPLFGTTAEPSGNDVASNNVVDTYVKDGNVIKGSYRAIRNDVYTFPTQTLGTITTGADQSLATAAAANTRAFWGLTAASMGTWHAAANKT